MTNRFAAAESAFGQAFVLAAFSSFEQFEFAKRELIRARTDEPSASESVRNHPSTFRVAAAPSGPS